MNNPKRKRFGVPPRWLNCPRIGNPVNDLFVPFKTPLDKKFDNEILPANRFNLEHLFDNIKMTTVGLVINLTKTDRYYNSDEIEKRVQYMKISCEGHDGPPSDEQVKNFINLCSNFLDHHDASRIGVHCTHGYNRTGFMIVAYLYEKCDVELGTAVHLFALARPPGIYKQSYLDELLARYDYEGDPLKAPDAPNWDEIESGDDEVNIPPDFIHYPQEEDIDFSDTENIVNTDVLKSMSKAVTRKKVNRKPFVEPKIGTFMEGVSCVSAVTDPNVIEEVQQKVRDMMNTQRIAFVGSQPVSMTNENKVLLHTKRYMVSWKADGTRYMMLIAGKGFVYMLDRDNRVFKVDNINFPRSSSEHLSDTLVDGEMVIDIYPDQQFPRYLIYDIMHIGTDYVGNKPFHQRLQKIRSEIIDLRTRYVTPQMKQRESFGVRIKEFWPLDKTPDLWEEGKFRQGLGHRMDGLIFQPAGPNDVYTIGRSQNILKWKPPETNSIDFHMKVNYNQEKEGMKRYVGYLYVTGANQHFATIENIKKDQREKYDNKIVECSWNKTTLKFDIIRERTDKSLPNHLSTAQAVFHSMQFPVTIQDLYDTIQQGYSSRL